MNRNPLVRLILSHHSGARMAALCVLSLVLLFGSTFALVRQVHAAGNTYYVAKDGANSNPGTEARPWLTVQYAATKLVAGDTVYVKNGIYSEYVWITALEGIRGGTAGNPITLKAYPGHRAIIDGTGLPHPGGYIGLVSISVPYTNLDGFEIRNNAAYSGVYVADTHDVTLSNLDIHNVFWEGIQVGSSSNVLIDRVQVYDSVASGKNESISIIASTHFEIKNSTIHDNKKEGINCKNGSSNGLIHDNDISNIPSDGIYLETTGIPQSNISIYGNRIRNSGIGIALGSELEPRAPQTGISIYNNFFTGNDRGLVAYPMDFIKTFSVTNNTFYHNGYAEIAVYDPAQYQVDCVIRNNIIVPNPGKANAGIIAVQGPAGITIDHNLFFNPEGHNPEDVFGTDYIQADPLLINALAGPGIASYSPAVDAGSPTSAPATDYLWTTRPQGTAYDIGAYEFRTVSTTTPPTTPSTVPPTTPTETHEPTPTTSVPPKTTSDPTQTQPPTTTAPGRQTDWPAIGIAAGAAIAVGGALGVVWIRRRK